MNNRVALLGLALAAVFLLPGQSCVTVTNNDDGNDDHGGGTANQVTLRFWNRTARAVDVQFYATGQAVSTVETDLFIAANQVTTSIGFAGSGLLEAGALDTVTLTCENARVLGTLGGRFLDANTGTLLGTGRQLVLYDGVQYACGDTVTFTYSESAGTFNTGLAVE